MKGTQIAQYQTGTLFILLCTRIRLLSLCRHSQIFPKQIFLSVINYIVDKRVYPIRLMWVRHY